MQKRGVPVAVTASASLGKILAEINSSEPANFIKISDPLIIYGAGRYGREVAQALLNRGYNVLGFLDRNAATTIDGLPCRHPAEDLHDWKPEKTVALVGVHNPYVNPIAIRDQLRSLLFHKVYVPVEYHFLLEPELGSRYWLGTQELYRERLGELQAAFALLADEKSRAIFISTLEYRALRRPDSQPTAEPNEAYFPSDLPRWSDALSWVDGGAFDGDSLRSVPLEKYSVRDVYLFEPDLKNFATLQTSIRSFREKSPATRISAWPCGLGAENCLSRFKTGLGPSSIISDNGNVHCPVVRLDDALQSNRVNFIKLDIEGAEPQALSGAAQTIQEQKPGLAVCIYHTPSHLWEIPLMIARVHPSYRFFVRSHNQNGFDLVLYAVSD